MLDYHGLDGTSGQGFTYVSSNMPSSVFDLGNPDHFFHFAPTPASPHPSNLPGYAVVQVYHLTPVYTPQAEW